MELGGSDAIAEHAIHKAEVGVFSSVSDADVGVVEDEKSFFKRVCLKQ